MITREQIQELAEFEDPEGCALSFYFQPTAPQNKAHKEDAHSYQRSGARSGAAVGE